MIFIKRLYKRISSIEWAVLFLLIVSVVFSISYFFRTDQWVKIEIKVSQKEWWWTSQPPPYWLTNTMHIGDKQYDSLGRKEVEIVDVKNYDLWLEKKIAFATLMVRAKYDNRKKKYVFGNQPLEVGNTLSLNTGSIGTHGLITRIYTGEDTQTEHHKKVEIKIIDEYYFDVFSETTGVAPWIADAFSVGDKMKDGEGRTIVDILKKNVLPAGTLVSTNGGVAYIAKNPLLKDVYLTVDLVAYKNGDAEYFLNEFIVKVGSKIPITLPNINFIGEITRIIE